MDTKKLLVICAWCAPVRNPLVSQGAPVSHTICPACLATLEAEAA